MEKLDLKTELELEIELEQAWESIKAIASYYGKESQSIVAIEELSELQKELCKMLRGIGSTEHLAEEIADVEIMLCQIKELYALDPMLISAQILLKTKRQIDRIANA